MNGLSISQLCCLFCCPPCPSRIAAKLAFLPPEPTYAVVPEPEYTVLFSHGNAVDLGQMSSFYIGLGTRINCNIFSYDYSGYGVSTGKPSERNLYSDIDAAWQALRTR
ncbi:PREDICTED: alpha/beta hydrolase domain-containing protein 17A-like, partial [Leptosomus discolor]|uniref:alpha/beta hydrolase domain-containing protein 17A-like n=1 Tax=Leptosomus discolor TaxID=188344 RepID=UPI000522A2BF